MEPVSIIAGAGLLLSSWLNFKQNKDINQHVLEVDRLNKQVMAQEAKESKIRDEYVESVKASRHQRKLEREKIGTGIKLVDDQASALLLENPDQKHSIHANTTGMLSTIVAPEPGVILPVEKLFEKSFLDDKLQAIVDQTRKAAEAEAEADSLRQELDRERALRKQLQEQQTVYIKKAVDFEKDRNGLANFLSNLYICIAIAGFFVLVGWLWTLYSRFKVGAKLSYTSSFADKLKNAIEEFTIEDDVGNETLARMLRKCNVDYTPTTLKRHTRKLEQEEAGVLNKPTV